MLNLEAHHKEHLQQLLRYTNNAIKEFCQLASEILEKKPLPKAYIKVAKQYDSQPELLNNILESLINLSVEGRKLKLDKENFSEAVTILGFNKDHAEILSDFYTVHEKSIDIYLEEASIKFSQYHDLKWRFEVQVGSRSVSQQTIPLVTIDLALKNQSKDKIEHIPLQTDPSNLKHMLEELDMALQEGLHQLRNVGKITK